jgi:hypothetical protein
MDRVSNLINCLTNDEDKRQDLWVHYLSGCPLDSLGSHLKQTQLEYTDDVVLRKAIWGLLQNPISEELSSFLSINFTDYERSILCMLMLDLDVSRISNIKGISEVRIRQSIASIRYNRAWSIYGIKNEVDRRRALWS